MLTTCATILAAISYGLLAPTLRRNRRLSAEIARLENSIETLSDRQWELREAEERTKSLLEAQGDVIVRRDTDGTCNLRQRCVLFAGRAQPLADLIGKRPQLDTLKLGAMSVLADGTRAYDQEIASPTGPRWISWHEVSVRPGRRHADRDTKRRPRCHRTRPRGALRSPKHAKRPKRQTTPRAGSSPWCRMKSARPSMASWAWPTSCATPR